MELDTRLTRFIVWFYFLLFNAVVLVSGSTCFNLPISTQPNILLRKLHTNMESENKKMCLRMNTKASELKCAFQVFDADFFNDTEVVEIAKEAIEFNLPIIRANRRQVAPDNGGLHNPSCLIFNPGWDSEHVKNANKKFKYIVLSGVQRPKSEEDVAFMSILELGELLRTKQITSQELV